MANFRVTEIKAFVPAKNFDVSKQFYKDIGFTMASEGGGVAYFHFEHVSFLLQDFCADSFAENFMMHMLVEDVDAWWDRVSKSGVKARYGAKLTQIELQPWRMRDFCVTDPSGVLCQWSGRFRAGHFSAAPRRVSRKHDPTTTGSSKDRSRRG